MSHWIARTFSAAPIRYLQARQRPSGGAVVLTIAGWVLLLLVGCSRDLPKEYGSSKGPSGLKSIDGFGTLRKSFEANGWKTQDVKRLGDRLWALDALVWIPTSTRQDETAAISWLHDWLGDKPRTLIYVIPDEGNEVRYWEAASDLAPPEQRLEYRRRHARALTDLMNGPYGGLDEPRVVLDRLWFKAVLRPSPNPRWAIFPHKTPVASLRLPTVSPVSPAVNTPTNAPPTNATGNHSNVNVVDGTIDWSLDGYDLSDESLTAEPLMQDESAVALAVRVYTSGKPHQTVDANLDNEAVNDSTAADSDAALDDDSSGSDWTEEDWDEHDEYDELLVRRQSGYGLGESEVIVVAGGSLISNYGIITPQGQELVGRILAETGKRRDASKPRIGFITGGSLLPISDSGDGPAAASGMELLTVWPLSLVTFHILMMGAIACLILFPIFGRPRRLKEKSSSDFADHIHAVAAMLHRTGGDAYARGRISDYFRRVRGETAGPWVLPLPATSAAPVTIGSSKPAVAPTAELASGATPVESGMPETVVEPPLLTETTSENFADDLANSATRESPSSGPLDERLLDAESTLIESITQPDSNQAAEPEVSPEHDSHESRNNPHER